MAEAFRTTQVVLASLALLVMVLGWLARKHPEVTWLRGFNLQARLTDDQRRGLRRSANVNAGAQLILLGVVLPVGYFLLKTMFFSGFTAPEVAIVAAGSLVCVVTGLIGMIRSLRR